tara:strand:- start:239 stop:1243 length:1005 start_codon:yes stop_codon:yes gene_type:complete
MTARIDIQLLVTKSMSEVACGKILGTQELGYRRGVPRGGGPYILISKKFIEMFPPLSQTIRNDRFYIDVVYNNSVTKATCAYVYHNDKHIDNPTSGRDEYRLYLNQSIHPGEQVFKPDDWVFFRQIPNNQGECVVHIQHYSSNSTDIEGIRPLVRPISKDARNRNFYCDSNVLPKIPIFSTLEMLPTIDDSLANHTKSASSRANREMSQAQFRAFVMKSYEGKCAITGQAITFGRLNNCEAAHIRPHAHDGPMLPDNGVPLSRDLHWAFDRGMFTIEDDGCIKVHPEVMDTSLNQINGQHLRKPSPTWSSFAPKGDYLRWHRENFFGKFIRSTE